MAKRSAALVRLLVGLDNPDSQDPAGFGREDVAAKLREVTSSYKDFFELHHYLHSPDYSRGGLAKRLRALKG